MAEQSVTHTNEGMFSPTVTTPQAPAVTIAAFLNERREAKLKGKEDAAVSARYNRSAWMGKLADVLPKTGVRAGTHIPKLTHSGVRKSFGTLDARAYLISQAGQRRAIGTHHLVNPVLDTTGDATQNALVLEVLHLVALPVRVEQGVMTFGEALVSESPLAVAALDDTPEKAEALRRIFVAFLQKQAEQEVHSSGALKQIYWLVMPSDKDKPFPACDNENYRLLQPLSSSSLTQAVQDQVWEMRRSEENKAQDKLRRAEKPSNGEHTRFITMLRKLGGTKPQNVSQLNSLRGGREMLFSCAPPSPKKWDGKISLAHRQESILPWILRQEAVWTELNTLGRWLHVHRNKQADFKERTYVQQALQKITCQIAVTAARLCNENKPGWSIQESCGLPLAEKLWLDPEGQKKLEEPSRQYAWGDWPEEVAGRIVDEIRTALNTRLTVMKSALQDTLGTVEAREIVRPILIDVAPLGVAVPQRRRLEKDRKAVLAAREGREER